MKSLTILAVVSALVASGTSMAASKRADKDKNIRSTTSTTNSSTSTSPQSSSTDVYSADDHSAADPSLSDSSMDSSTPVVTESEDYDPEMSPASNARSSKDSVSDSNVSETYDSTTTTTTSRKSRIPASQDTSEYDNLENPKRVFDESVTNPEGQPRSHKTETGVDTTRP